MKRNHLIFGGVLAAALGVFGGSVLNAQDPTKSGTILHRSDIAGGMEAILVLRELPPGVASGKHTQSGTEIVYVQDGSITVEIEGKPPVTLKTGESFSTTAGQVHNVKNASSTAPAKALAFYVAKKGTPLEGLSIPEKK